LYGCVLSACLAGAAIAQAGPNAGLQASLYTQGSYQAAASAAEQDGTADSLAFAARALLAQGMTETPEGEEPDAALVARARKDAERALVLDGGHHEASLQLAIALSIQTRSMGVMEAWRSGDGERARKLAERVLKADPVNIYALGFLAVWHVEVRRRGGAVGAQMMGASLQEAEALYARAVQAAPDDVGVHWQYGRALAALDSKRFSAQALAALDAAVAATADNHVEQVMQARARALADLLREDRRKAEQRAAGML
jgi:tetratricopeptide (TPR) repeat protein